MFRSNPASCSIDDRELLAYRDGELTTARREALAGHVAACPECQRRLDATALIAATLKAATPPRDLPAARAAIRAQIAGNQVRWWQQRASLVTALPVVILLVAIIGIGSLIAANRCPGCPPPTEPMRVTASAGVPAGWRIVPPPQAQTNANSDANSNASAGAARSPYAANQPAIQPDAASRPSWNQQTQTAGAGGQNVVQPPNLTRRPAINSFACAQSSVTQQYTNCGQSSGAAQPIPAPGS